MVLTIAVNLKGALEQAARQRHEAHGFSYATMTREALAHYFKIFEKEEAKL